MVFVSDNGSTDPGSGAIVGIAIQEQTAQCLRSIRAVLEAAGSGLDRAVNATVILNDEATSVA